MVQKKRRSPSDRWKSPFLKEFELLTGSIWELRFGTIVFIAKSLQNVWNFTSFYLSLQNQHSNYV